MVYCRGVVSGSNNTVIIADMPFGSYQFDESLAFLNAIKFINRMRARLGQHEAGSGDGFPGDQQREFGASPSSTPAAAMASAR